MAKRRRGKAVKSGDGDPPSHGARAPRGRQPTSSGAKKRAALVEDDEAELWRTFTRNIDPLGHAPRVPDAEAAFIDAVVRREVNRTERVTVKPGAGHRPEGRAAKSSDRHGGRGSEIHNADGIDERADQAPKGPEVRAHGAIDAGRVKRLGRGRDAVEARIDLHGMRQTEAHAALRAFLMRSLSKGHRMVLVITGKGSGDREANDFTEFVNEGRLSRGILRQRVPSWLDAPDLKAIVAGYTTAHIRHGGEGALYVQLRRRK